MIVAIVVFLGKLTSISDNFSKEKVPQSVDRNPTYATKVSHFGLSIPAIDEFPGIGKKCTEC
jgi:hypothetical protein